METLRTAVDRLLDRTVAGPFLTSATTDEALGSRAFVEAVRQAATRFVEVGTERGDRIATLLPPSPVLVTALLGAPYVGRCAHPLNPKLSPGEIAAQLADARARVLVTSAAMADVVREVTPSLPDLVAVLSIDQPFEGATLLEDPRSAEARALELPAPAPEDPALVLYTSGTTGPSKGALLTHRNLVVNTDEIIAWLGLDASDRFLCIMPLFHANGLVITVFTPLRLGASIVLEDGFHPSRFWDVVARHEPTLFGSVATMLAMLLNHPPPATPPRSLRYALCGSAPVPVDVIERFEAATGVAVVEGYGLTESTCRATFNPPHRRRPGSIGLPIGNELRIVDGDGTDVADGETGELWLRGANVMAGYLDAPEATARALDPDGWLHTGDVGRRDADGYVFLIGRRTDLILRGGENVYPREIEEVLHHHPDVLEAAVVGLPDPLYGETVVAVVTAREGARDLETALRGRCEIALAPFKRPTRYQFVASLPKGPTGKILRRRVREDLASPERF